MKKLLLGLIVPLIAVASYGAGAYTRVAVKEVPVVKTVTVTKTITPATYHVGDSQSLNGDTVTLTNMYQSTLSNTHGHYPVTDTLLTFQLNTTDQAFASKALVYLSDGTYLTPNAPTVSGQCTGSCVGFVVPSNLSATEFMYGDLTWHL